MKTIKYKGLKFIQADLSEEKKKEAIKLLLAESAAADKVIAAIEAAMTASKAVYESKGWRAVYPTSDYESPVKEWASLKEHTKNIMAATRECLRDIKYWKGDKKIATPPRI